MKSATRISTFNSNNTVRTIRNKFKSIGNMINDSNKVLLVIDIQEDTLSNYRLCDFLKESNINEVFIVGLDVAACIYKTAIGAIKSE